MGNICPTKETKVMEGFGSLVIVGLFIYIAYNAIALWLLGRNRNKDV